MYSRAEKILVTGSSGFIGRAVVKRMAPSFDVIGLDQKDPQNLPPGAEFVTADFKDGGSIQQALTRVHQRHGDRLAAVIHLAAYYDFSGKPSPLYDEITVRGTERLLSGLRNFRVEQFIFSSTMLVHAPCQPGQRINEDWPLEPKWDYPRSKVRTEELLRAHHGIPKVILRIAGVYDDLCHSIPLAHQMQRIYERQFTSHVFPGDTSHGQAFLHLDDLVSALWLLVHHRAQMPSEQTLLLGEPETFSYETLQREFGWHFHGEEWETRQIPKALAKAGAWLQDNLPLMEDPFIKPWMIDLADDHFALDITRIRKLLGWEPRHSLFKTIPQMVSALKADPPAWCRENKLEPSPMVEEQVAQTAGRGSHEG